MNPRDLTNEQLMQQLRDAQLSANLATAFTPQRGAEGSMSARLRERRQRPVQQAQVAELAAELQRRRVSGQITDGQIRAEEIDIQQLARAVQEQAVANARSSVALEREIDPTTAAMREAGQAAVTQAARGEDALARQGQDILDRALREAGIVTPTPEVTNVPRVGTQRVALPDAPTPPQLGGMPSVNLSQVVAPGMNRSEGYNPALIGNVGMANVAGPTAAAGYNPALIGDVGAATPERIAAQQIDATPREVAEIQREVEQRALDELRLGGQLTPAERAEVVRQALATAGAVGVTGGTARDITARDLGLSSRQIAAERAARAAQAGAVTEARNSEQQQLEASRRSANAAATNRVSEFNAAQSLSAQEAALSRSLQAAGINAQAANDAARLASQQSFEAGESFASRSLAAQESALSRALQAAGINAQAANDAARLTTQLNFQGAESAADRSFNASQLNASQANETARFLASMQDARERFNAGTVSEFAMAAYNAALQAGMRDADAANEALRVEANFLMQAQENQRGRQFQAGESAATRSQDAMSRALSFVQGQQQQQLSAGLAGASTDRPSFGLDPSSIADLMIANVNQRNQVALANQAIRAQQQSNNAAAGAGNVMTVGGRGIVGQAAPFEQTISTPQQIRIQPVRLNTVSPTATSVPSGMPTAPRPSALATGAIGKPVLKGSIKYPTLLPPRS